MKKKFYPDFPAVSKIPNFYNDVICVCSFDCYSLNCVAGNFNQEEISDPILDITLESGDMLYFPRGTIHQVIMYFFIHHF